MSVLPGVSREISMNRRRVPHDRLQGLFFHAGGAAALFICWRLFGLPSPGLDGRILPICWLAASAVFARGRPHPAAAACLITACIASAFWRAGPAVLLVVRISSIAGLFPA